jgi:predicted aspartyl protease
MAKGSISVIYPYKTDGFNLPAPVLEVSLSLPMTSGDIIKVPALLDSGADMTVIPRNVVQQLQLKYVDEILAVGFDGIVKKTFVYSTKIIFDKLGDFIIRVITSENDHALIGRDILNRWSVFLRGREKVFEIS